MTDLRTSAEGRPLEGMEEERFGRLLDDKGNSSYSKKMGSQTLERPVSLLLQTRSLHLYGEEGTGSLIPHTLCNSSIDLATPSTLMTTLELTIHTCDNESAEISPSSFGMPTAANRTDEQQSPANLFQVLMLR
ncbi:teashirt-like protein 2 [Platysternon megacephalum]|uniref:Teashirt-like protein 2 n=1 Tax=Platysternon megacephalum TaxID=55544 RepID=A0A4D9EQV5_9SAUR|nr:teashirt-like protein 2 [Platysternon megacephalum]